MAKTATKKAPAKSRAKKKAADQKTIVTFLLDRSSSMMSIKASTLTAFNAYLDGMRDADNIDFSLLQFCTNGVDKICTNVPIKTAPALSNENYQPERGGSTPLIDAAYETIKAVETLVAQHDTAPKVVICIQTDGEENSSVSHTWRELTQLIKEKTALGWEFNFMGAGIDAYQQGSRMGIGVANTVSYDSADLASTQSSFRASAANTRSFAAGLSATTAYSAKQKLDSGDKFWSPPQPASASQAKRFHATAKPIVDKIKL